MAKWKLVKVKTHEKGRPGMELEIDGHLMKHGEFFTKKDGHAVYEYNYVSSEKDGNDFKFEIVAHLFNKESRTKVTDEYNNRLGCEPLFDKTSGEGYEYLPDFKERDPEAERGEELWKKASGDVKAKYKAQSAPCDWNEDGSPDFRMMVCGNGVKGFAEELKAMKCDYTGEYSSHPKFPREAFVGFKTEEEAVDAYMEDQNWIISRWDGKAWRELKVKREKGSKKMEVVWAKA